MSVFQVIRALTTLITIPVYLILFAVLIKDRKSHFQSAFFILFISTGCANLLNCTRRIIFEYIPVYILSIETYVKSPLPIATSVMGSLYYVFYVQVIGIIIISANRLTAVSMPLTHEKIWSTKLTKTVVLVQWILPFPWILPMMHSCCQAKFYSNESLFPIFVSEKTNEVIFLIDGMFSFCVAVPIIVSSNLTTAFFVRKYKSSPGTWMETANLRTVGWELRLAFVGGFLSASYTLAISNQIYYFLVFIKALPDSSAGYYFVYTWYLIFFDIYTLSNPYLLIFMSSLVRRRFLRIIGFKPTDVNVETPVTGNFNRRD